MIVMCICGNVIDHLHLYSHNVYYVKLMKCDEKQALASQV